MDTQLRNRHRFGRLSKLCVMGMMLVTSFLLASISGLSPLGNSPRVGAQSFPMVVNPPADIIFQMDDFDEQVSWSVIAGTSGVAVGAFWQVKVDGTLFAGPFEFTTEQRTTLNTQGQVPLSVTCTQQDPSIYVYTLHVNDGYNGLQQLDEVKVTVLQAYFNDLFKPNEIIGTDEAACHNDIDNWIPENELEVAGESTWQIDVNHGALTADCFTAVTGSGNPNYWFSASRDIDPADGSGQTRKFFRGIRGKSLVFDFWFLSDLPTTHVKAFISYTCGGTTTVVEGAPISNADQKWGNVQVFASIPDATISLTLKIRVENEGIAARGYFDDFRLSLQPVNTDTQDVSMTATETYQQAWFKEGIPYSETYTIDAGSLVGSGKLLTHIRSIDYDPYRGGNAQFTVGAASVGYDFGPQSGDPWSMTSPYRMVLSATLTEAPVSATPLSMTSCAQTNDRNLQLDPAMEQWLQHYNDKQMATAWSMISIALSQLGGAVTSAVVPATETALSAAISIASDFSIDGMQSVFTSEALTGGDDVYRNLQPTTADPGCFVDMNIDPFYNLDPYSPNFNKNLETVCTFSLSNIVPGKYTISVQALLFYGACAVVNGQYDYEDVGGSFLYDKISFIVEDDDRQNNHLWVNDIPDYVLANNADATNWFELWTISDEFDIGSEATWTLLVNNEVCSSGAFQDDLQVPCFYGGEDPVDQLWELWVNDGYRSSCLMDTVHIYVPNTAPRTSNAADFVGSDADAHGWINYWTIFDNFGIKPAAQVKIFKDGQEVGGGALTDGMAVPYFWSQENWEETWSVYADDGYTDLQLLDSVHFSVHDDDTDGPSIMYLGFEFKFIGFTLFTYVYFLISDPSGISSSSARVYFFDGGWMPLSYNSITTIWTGIRVGAMVPYYGVAVDADNDRPNDTASTTKYC